MTMANFLAERGVGVRWEVGWRVDFACVLGMLSLCKRGLGQLARAQRPSKSTKDGDARQVTIPTPVQEANESSLQLQNSNATIEKPFVLIWQLRARSEPRRKSNHIVKKDQDF